ncbi:MAG: hypothetical protein FWE27_05620 [Defluviitaleaceae bacterium]|nr:hypothetical protein [Defluviitaleaceae bacterium]
MNITQLQQEHDKQNENYVSEKAKIFSGIRVSKAKLETNANARLDKLCEALAGISEISGSYIEAVDLFVSFFDDVILECIYASRRAEIEEKIFALCKKALEKPNSDGNRNANDEHITAKLIDCLNTEPSAIVSRKMAAALLDNTNPLRLGLSFYENFCEKNPVFTDVVALDYLKVETAVREALIKNTNPGDIPPIEKLLASPFDCPEKYLLTALNFFYHGYKDDALNALNIGLNKFPANERLTNAKDALAE